MPALKRFWQRLEALVHSIRFRLVVWFAAILVLILAAFCAFVYFLQSRNLHANTLNRLEQRMALIGEMHFFGPNIVLPANFLQENEVLVVLDPNGNVLASQGPIPASDVLRLAETGLQAHPQPGSSPTAFISWTGTSPQTRTDYQFLIAPLVEERGLIGFVIFGGPLDPNGQLRGLQFTLIVGSLLTLAVALGGGLWLADRAMRPVQTITRAAREISETDLSRRLNMRSRDELGELANTFDAMLVRLQAAFERQRQFVGDASHELRTPLTIVNLQTNRALATRRSGKEYQQALEAVRSENNWMIRLVNNLLTLARMDSGEAKPACQPLDLSDVALEAVERLSPLAERNQVRLETGDLPETSMCGDRQYLLQMVNNLVENGIKYTTGPDRRVRVETGTEADKVWVRVSDNGPGIAPEHIPHLFDRFYRVDKSRNRNGDEAGDPQSGSGLGLSIVQWIAKAHGGDIRLTSTPGQGATFEVVFPASPAGETLPDH